MAKMKKVQTKTDNLHIGIYKVL